MSNYAIQIHNISIKRNDEYIFQHLNGNFTKGSITALIGPSGSGKTTLLKMLNGLISPTSGEIEILDTDIQHYNPVELRTIVGIALQDAPIIRGTVYDNLHLPYKLKGQTLDKELAVSALQQVLLDPSLLHRDANDLSGGQRQRLSLARTLLNEPSILLLDETTSALDPQTTYEIEQLIMKLSREKGVTVVWITHNKNQALHVSDSFYLIADGSGSYYENIEQLYNEENVHLTAFLKGGDAQWRIQH